MEELLPERRPKRLCKTGMDGGFGGTLMVQNTMKMNTTLQPSPVLSVLLTLTGISVGLLLSLLAVWGDYESTSYGFLKRASAPFGGLSCPILLGKNETGIISLQITNSTDRRLSPGVRTEISTSQEPVSELEFVPLAPGERSTLQRTVGPENVDLGSFILVSASVFSMYPLPDQEMTCGIFVLPVAGGSQPLLILGTTVSLLLMFVGSFFLYRKVPRAGPSRPLLFMVIATALALLFSFKGSWLLALLLIIAVILTFLIASGSLFE